MLNVEDEKPAPAGFWIRVVARAIDWVAVWTADFAASVFLALIGGMARSATGFNSHAFTASLSKTTWVLWVGSVIGTLSYYVICEGVCGATAGKWAIGAQVVGVDVSRCRVSQALIRTISIVVDGMFFGTIGAMSVSNSPLKQRVGDHWADTYVAKRNALPSNVRSSPMHVLATTIVGLVVAGLASAVTKVLQYLWITSGA